jgi:flagellar motility protein MotE (MotC chaperone)
MNTTVEEIEAVDELFQETVKLQSEHTAKCEELKRSIHDKELTMAKFKLRAEQNIREYNNQLSTIPNSDEMKITFNEDGKDLVDILSVDIDNVILVSLYIVL